MREESCGTGQSAEYEKVVDRHTRNGRRGRRRCRVRARRASRAQPSARSRCRDDAAERRHGTADARSVRHEGHLPSARLRSDGERPNRRYGSHPACDRCRRARPRRRRSQSAVGRRRRPLPRNAPARHQHGRRRRGTEPQHDDPGAPAGLRRLLDRRRPERRDQPLPDRRRQRCAGRRRQRLPHPALAGRLHQQRHHERPVVGHAQRVERQRPPLSGGVRGRRPRARPGPPAVRSQGDRVARAR